MAGDGNVTEQSDKGNKALFAAMLVSCAVLFGCALSTYLAIVVGITWSFAGAIVLTSLGIGVIGITVDKFITKRENKEKDYLKKNKDKSNKDKDKDNNGVEGSGLRK